MSKIICDVCGTAFAENAAQCPICGSVKRGNPMTANGNTDAAEESGYKTTKGGRFSKRNVRKRNQEAVRQSQPENNNNDQEDEKSNKGLMILMFVLIGAVIAVVLYILLRLVGPSFTQPTDPTKNPGTLPPTQPTAPSSAPTDPTAAPTDPTVPCDGLVLNVPRIELNSSGATAAIDVTATPADKTDPIKFTSSNEYVAVVDENGVVTAVGNGNATITITCGQFHVDCTVVVDMPTEPPTEPPTVPPTEEPTEPPTEEPTEPPTESSGNIEFYSDDIMFFGEGESCYLYTGDVDEDEIYWYTMDSSVAIIEDGVVTAIGPGVTEVYAEYEGESISCIVRCNWEAPDPTNPPLDPDETYYISHSDVTLSVGEGFRLTLRDSEGEVMDVDWQVSESGYVEIDGNWITGVDNNRYGVTVYVTVGNDTYSCVVRVN